MLGAIWWSGFYFLVSGFVLDDVLDPGRDDGVGRVGWLFSGELERLQLGLSVVCFGVDLRGVVAEVFGGWVRRGYRT